MASDRDQAATGAEAEVEAADEGHARAYWKANIRLLVMLMSIWFIASFGCGILLRGFLDRFMIGGFPLGFWFAQQGSIYVFIVLVFFYAWKMKRIERRYDLGD